MAALPRQRPEAERYIDRMSATPKPFNSRQVRVGNAVIKVMSKSNTWIYRVTNGKVGAKFKGGAPVALFTTTGRKSKQLRTVPLIFMHDGDDMIIVASKGGMPSHPEWYLNLCANPEVKVELGTESWDALATVVSDEERATLWPRLVQVYADYDDYQKRTERTIPVLRVARR